MHPLKCYHLAASEMDLYKLFHGKPSERAKKGDRVLLIRTIQLTADLTVTCPVTFLMLPDIQFITKPLRCARLGKLTEVLRCCAFDLARKQKVFSLFCILTNDSIGSRYLFTRNEQMPDILLHCHLLPQKAKDSAADGQ